MLNSSEWYNSLMMSSGPYLMFKRAQSGVGFGKGFRGRNPWSSWMLRPTPPCFFSLWESKSPVSLDTPHTATVLGRWIAGWIDAELFPLTFCPFHYEGSKLHCSIRHVVVLATCRPTDEVKYLVVCTQWSFWWVRAPGLLWYMGFAALLGDLQIIWHITNNKKSIPI